MRRASLIGTCLLLVPVLGGCVTTLTTQKFSKATTGVGYFLPKVLFRLDVTYTVTKKRTKTWGILAKEASSTVAIAKPIKLTAFVIADPKNHVAISADDAASSAMLESTFGFKVAENGLLQSVDLDVTDHSGDVVQESIGTVVSLAKLAASAMAGESPLDPLKERLHQIYTSMSAVFTEADVAKRLMRLQSIAKEIDAINAVIDAYTKMNAAVTEDKDVVFSTVLDPSTFAPPATAKGERDYVSEVVPTNFIEGVLPIQLPKVRVFLRVSPTEIARSIDVVDETTHRGIAHRAPLPVEVRIESSVGDSGGMAETLRDIFLIPQFGEIAYADFASKRAAQRKTSAAFSSATGAMTAYSVASSSSADKMLKQIGTGLDSAQKGLLDAEYDVPTDILKRRKARSDAQKDLRPPSLAEAELEHLKQQQALVEAQLALEKAKQELKQLKQP